MEVRERLLGPEDPDVLQSLNNLAKLYENQKKYDEAEQYYQRVLETRKKVLGPEHPDIAKTIKDLAETYYKHGKQSEAEMLYKKWVEMNEKVQNLDNTVFSASDVDAAFGGVKSPKIISKVKPSYTNEARNNRVEGVVVLAAVFRKDGTISDIEIIRSLGHGLDEEAVKAAMKIKFFPGQKDGKPVNVRARIEFTFALG